MNEHMHLELLSRIRKEGKYSTQMMNCLNSVARVGNDFEEQRAKIAKDTHLSEVGRRAKVTEVARAMVKDLLEAGKPSRFAMAQVVGGRMELKPKPVETTDARGELRRSEVRSYIRGLKSGERLAAAMELSTDDEALNALLDAPAALSGLPAEQHAHLGKVYAERHHGARIAELDGIEADAQAAGAGVDIVMSDLRKASGLPEHGFAQHVSAVQAEMDKGW